MPHPRRPGVSLNPLPDPAAFLDPRLDAVADALAGEGWLLIEDFVPEALWRPLAARAVAIDDYTPAGVGRGDDWRRAAGIRTDRIRWLDAAHPDDASWLDAMEQLRLAINGALFMGLFEYEAHFASYAPGAYYRRHLDAFRGGGDRLVSTVLYLNGDWRAGRGGELVLYPAECPEGILVAPRGGTLAVFLSEEMPHEVLPTQVPRHSIAGWFRRNRTDSTHLDPAN